MKSVMKTAKTMAYASVENLSHFSLFQGLSLSPHRKTELSIIPTMSIYGMCNSTIRCFYSFKRNPIMYIFHVF